MSENILTDEELEVVNGGSHMVTNPAELYEGCICLTHVETGYLALRNAAEYNDNNIIGQLWNGSLVSVMDYAPIGDYIYVVVRRAAPGQWGGCSVYARGYVDWRYLKVKDNKGKRV